MKDDPSSTAACRCVAHCEVAEATRTPSAATTTADLSHWLDQAPSRLRLLAISLGLFSLAGLVLNAIGPSTFGWHVACARFGVATETLFVVVTGAFLWALKSGRYTAKTLVNFGLAFVLLKAFGLSLMERAQPFVGVSLVSVLIVLFPLFVPTSLRKTILVAYGAALTGPLAAMVYDALVASAPHQEGEVWAAHFINFFVATLAIVPAWTMRRMGREMRRARQMGSYELSELIGRGGMGEVWRADHRMLRRPAAIKLIHPEAIGAATPEKAQQLFARFEREAQATAALHSAHTIEVYDFGVTPEGEFFYVMELLDGFDLETLVEQHGPLSAARTVALLLQIGDSLEDAHRSGLIHRDIKPANIFVCRYGYKVDFVKVLDFGLVKASGGEGHAKLTADGATAGTPACMAPELALGEGPIDHRVDLYALGCVAYWLLTGALVFEASGNMQMLIKHVQDTPAAPSQRSEFPIPAALDELVLDLLAKDPAQRPQTAREMVDRLRMIELEEDWSEERAERWWQAHRPATVSVSSLETPAVRPVQERLRPAVA